MQLDVVRTWPEWQALEGEWNQLLERSVVRVPFLRHEFLSAWWRRQGGSQEWLRGELYVVAARRQRVLVAAAPLFLAADGERQVLALIGSHMIADYLDFLAVEEHLPAFVDALLEHLLGPAAPEWEALDLYNLPEASPTLAALRRAACVRGLSFGQVALGECRCVSLPGDWETYLRRTVDKKQRHEIRRKLRRGDEAGDTRWYFVNAPEAIPAAAKKLLQMLAQHDYKTQTLTPALRAQLVEIVAAAFRGGWLRLAFLEIQGEVCAATLGFDFDNRLWIYNTGYDERFRDLSPGWLLMGHLIRWAIEQRRAAVDFLRVDPTNKQRFGAESRHVVRASVRRAAAAGPVAAAADPLPDDATLAAGLAAAAVEERIELSQRSDGPCEIVACRMRDGSRARFFCKFGPAGGAERTPHGFGVAYEAMVYEQVLAPRRCDVPRLHAAFQSAAPGRAGLALEYLDDVTRLTYLALPQRGLVAAARWIARFHRAGVAAGVPSFLHRYDSEYYCRHVGCAARFARGLGPRFQPLADLCQKYQPDFAAILPAEVVIHGDYRADNILYREDRLLPVDWESAALATGVIDVAMLTWGWGEKVDGTCTREYCRVRWPAGTPADFAWQLVAARLFLELRWLGRQPDDVGADEGSSNWDGLFAAAEAFERQATARRS